MGKITLRGKDLDRIGYPTNRSKSKALVIVARHFKHHTAEQQLALLKDVLLHPDAYRYHEVLHTLAAEFIDEEPVETMKVYELHPEPLPYRIFGRKHIEADALAQMDWAMRLPVSRRGALMPDAHAGYGLPIGGVLATANAVIPYAVGVDIGCRMSLSVFDAPSAFLEQQAHRIRTAIREHTFFGADGVGEPWLAEHPVLDDEAFRALPVLQKLQGKALRQIGTSGSGNHFVEAGIVVVEEENALQLPAGQYFGLLSHSGSRGLGAHIAGHYTRIAMEQCLLPKEARHLAWLDLDTEAGEEYWLAMELAGAYAAACHDVIHARLAAALGVEPIARVENHHNFAWKEKDENGQTLIVHRKGATPAAQGELGIIPASMTGTGYIVSGLGYADSLHSAAHGAGRKMSRRKARMSLTGSDLRKMINRAGITLIGGGIDEAPLVYKDLDEVMACQQELVQVEGKFIPRIVRMDKN